MKLEEYNALTNMLALLHGRIENGAELHKAIEWAQDELVRIAGGEVDNDERDDIDKLVGIPYVDVDGKVQFALPDDADPSIIVEPDDEKLRTS